MAVQLYGMAEVSVDDGRPIVNGVDVIGVPMVHMPEPDMVQNPPDEDEVAVTCEQEEVVESASGEEVYTPTTVVNSELDATIPYMMDANTTIPYTCDETTVSSSGVSSVGEESAEKDQHRPPKRRLEVTSESDSGCESPINKSAVIPSMLPPKSFFLKKRPPPSKKRDEGASSECEENGVKKTTLRKEKSASKLNKGLARQGTLAKMAVMNSCAASLPPMPSTVVLETVTVSTGSVPLASTVRTTSKKMATKSLSRGLSSTVSTSQLPIATVTLSRVRPFTASASQLPMTTVVKNHPLSYAEAVSSTHLHQSDTVPTVSASAPTTAAVRFPQQQSQRTPDTVMSQSPRLSEYATPTWDPSRTPKRSHLRPSRTCTPRELKKKLNWECVDVYYFDREQGKDTVPGEGEVTLGMADRHHAERTFFLSRKGQPFIDIEVEEEEQLSSGEEEAPYFERCTAKNLQPIHSAKQRSKLLKVAGVRVEKASTRELEALRQSRREECGCRCTDGICNPETCECALDGIKCQLDDTYPQCYPCACVSATCANPIGRVEFDREKVEAHHRETMQRWRDMQRTGVYAAPSRRRLDSFEETNSYCETPESQRQFDHRRTAETQSGAGGVALRRLLDFDGDEVKKQECVMDGGCPTVYAVSSTLNSVELAVPIPPVPIVNQRERTPPPPAPAPSVSASPQKKRFKSPAREPSPIRRLPVRTSSLTRLAPFDPSPAPKAGGLMKTMSTTRLPQIKGKSPSRLRVGSDIVVPTYQKYGPPVALPAPRVRSSSETVLPSSSYSVLPLRTQKHQHLSPTREDRTPSPEEEDERPAHHKFPVTPVYSRLHSSRLSISSSSISLPSPLTRSRRASQGDLGSIDTVNDDQSIDNRPSINMRLEGSPRKKGPPTTPQKAKTGTLSVPSSPRKFPKAPSFLGKL